MMGNENSQLKGLEIEEEAVEITDFWSLYRATIKDSCSYFSLKGDGSVSVFKGEAALGPLWTISTPLEKFSNNLLKYRHPCIVRYISAWQQRSTLHLATEFVQPLSHVLKSYTPLQRCIGLNNILRALVFLHEQAGKSHNNICLSAVYVTGDGQWKLGGLQYLCDFNEVTTVFLKQARITRYDKAVDPNEDAQEVNVKVDHFAFAVFVEEVFAGCSDDDVPHLNEFRQYCREYLQHTDPAKRPPLSEVLQHNFFNHEFISIYKFLNFLPLKTDEEKSDFFSNILENLSGYDEETVAKQLGGLLLSRLTMLDLTARKDVIPFILRPKNERIQNGEQNGYFSMPIFKEHVKPRLMQLFSVRDSQIRMVLLTHFNNFVHVFTQEELSCHILPELLLGIKDIDDNLVASTLMCLSYLVPILGAETVIGGKRTKLFSDGRPNPKSNVKTQNQVSISNKTSFQTKPLYNFHCSESVYESNSNDMPYDKSLNLIERPSPVGGESIDVMLNDAKPHNLNDSEEDWSDWENSNSAINEASSVVESVLKESSISFVSDPVNLSSTMLIGTTDKHKPQERSQLLQKAALEAKKNIIDISELDIKNQKYNYSKKNSEEFDFFADMAPVIEKPTVAVAPISDTNNFNSKLNFIPNEDTEINEEGWGELE